MAENKTEKNINLQPQSLEAEEAVLGAMMIDDAAANKAIGLLKSSHYFYKEAHKKYLKQCLFYLKKVIQLTPYQFQMN